MLIDDIDIYSLPQLIFSDCDTQYEDEEEENAAS